MFRKKLSTIVMSLFIGFLLSSCIKHTTNAKQATISVKPAQAIEGGAPYDDPNNPPKWIAAIYQGSIRKGKISICTGEFVSDEYILTAFHCIEDNLNNLDDFSVQYRALRDGIPIYSKIKVKSFIAFNDKDDIVLLKLEKKYLAPIEMVPLYHNFIFNKYNSVVNNKIDIKHLGYGDLKANPVEENVNTLLMQITGKVFKTYNNSSMLITVTKGANLAGDSGGPVLYTNTPTDKLIGIFVKSKDVKGSLLDSVLITKDILEWIATTTGVPIFNNIVENQYILVSKDNIIKISGWGNMPDNAKIVIYNSNNDYKEPVTSCDKFTHTIDNQWHCSIEFPSNYDYSKYENYKISIISNNKEMDYVYFKLSTSVQNIKILHPSKHTDGSNVWFIYHTPVGESYLITGTATPGTYLTYDLIDKFTKQTNESPCINHEAMELVSNTGIWKCRIMVQTPEIKAYDFTVGLDRSREPLPDNRKRPLAPSIDTVQYKVEPLRENFNLVFKNPLEGSTVLYPYQITADINHNGVPLLLQLSMHSGINQYYRESNIIHNKEYSSEVFHKGADGDFNLRASLYLDNDEKPIFTKTMKYIVKSHFIKITSPEANSELEEGANVYPQGTATDTTNILAAPELQVVVFISQTGSYGDEYLCDAIVINGKWACAKYDGISISTLAPGTYKIAADLIDNDSQTQYASDEVFIKITNNVKLSSPSSSTPTSELN